MKTAEQIKNWLKQQEWYDKFEKYVRECNCEEFVNEILEGKRGEDTICGAFFWDSTEESNDYWNKIDNQFLSWFRSVWYKADEHPREGEYILSITDKGTPIVCGPNHADWEGIVKEFGIVKYAYVEELEMIKED